MKQGASWILKLGPLVVRWGYFRNVFDRDIMPSTFGVHHMYSNYYTYSANLPYAVVFFPDVGSAVQDNTDYLLSNSCQNLGFYRPCDTERGSR